MDLIYNILLLISSIALISIIYSLFNYNPMYSLLFFILFLFNITFMLFIQNYEFISILVGLIYFGAILILFFFILLLINLQVVVRDNLHIKRVPIPAVILFIIFINIIYNTKLQGFFILKYFIFYNKLTTLESIGITMFNNFGLHIIIVGLILFLTLIGLVIILVSNKSIKLKFLRKSI